ncbi:hypothetical protein GCM10023214_59960 [Amycolatopsis dongchuanensis]|uniref:Uncharacterized protein n=1 Tax=Amycolatopsis dongchuanensis TaxID=1070866 RepID=A0ABP8VDK9_9PSEU
MIGPSPGTMSRRAAGANLSHRLLDWVTDEAAGFEHVTNPAASRQPVSHVGSGRPQEKSRSIGLPGEIGDSCGGSKSPRSSFAQSSGVGSL